MYLSLLFFYFLLFFSPQLPDESDSHLPEDNPTDPEKDERGKVNLTRYSESPNNGGGHSGADIRKRTVSPSDSVKLPEADAVQSVV